MIDARDIPAHLLYRAIELLPRDKKGWRVRQWYYRKVYLRTHHWKNKRFRGKGICHICMQPGAYQTHHLNYDRMWNERRDDLVRVHGGKCHEIADAMRRNKQK